jgi:predicted permease
MLDWLLDTRYAARRLARSPFFTTLATLILAVGIGANTAAFSVVDAMLFRPPPFERPDEIVFIYQDSDEGEPSSSAYPAYRDIAGRTDLFAGVAATSPEVLTWETDAGPRQASVEFATSSFFPLLGVRPSRGSWFSREHDFVGAGTFAVVSHRTWRSELGGAADLIGSVIRLNGQPVTVIGVGPSNYNGAGGSLVTDFWLSISTTPVAGDFRVQNLDRREDHWYDVVARLAPGVSVEQARAGMDALALQMGEANPELDRGRGLTVFARGEVRLHPEVDGILFPVGVGLMVVVGLVLLLACSNLANLLLVRGVSRSHEMAVRQALGARRGRLVRLYLLEALLLSLLGGGAGVLLASWVIGLLPRLPIPTPASMTIDVGIDGRVLTFSAALALATALFFGLLPAARATEGDVAGPLRDDQRSSSSGRGAFIRRGLVGVQVAVSLVLLVGAGLFARSLSNARAVDVGFDAERLALLGVDPSQGGLPPEVGPQLMEDLVARIGARPGVSGVTFTTRLPVQRGGTTTTVVEGYTPPTGTDAVELSFAYVTPSYFETLGIPLLQGRTFGLDDRPETQRVIVVNETAARRFWNGDALGKRVRPQGNANAWREVIGVVRDVKVGELNESATPMMYFSTTQVSIGCCYVLARSEGDPEALLPTLRSALREAAPQLSPTRLGTVEAHLSASLAAPRAAAALMGGFSVLALVLATLGVYAVVSFAVARRSAEIGIRLALGAARSRLIGMVVAESLVTVGAGVAIGLIVALLAAPALDDILFQVGARDPLAFATGALLLVLVGALASWVPAFRAARTSPVEVLRSQ